MKPRILLSDLIRQVVADAEQLAEQGVVLDMSNWLFTEDRKKVCSVCLGGTRLLKKVPDVLMYCKAGLADAECYGSLPSSLFPLPTGAGEKHVFGDVYLWREMVVLDEIRLGQHARAFRDYYRRHDLDPDLAEDGEQFLDAYVGGTEEFGTMCQSLLDTADAIAVREERFGITIEPVEEAYP